MPELILKQSSFWNAWSFDIIQSGRSSIGQIMVPDYAQASNARVALVPAKQAVAAHMTVHDRPYRIRYEYLSRAWNSNVAWWLEDEQGEVLSRITKHFREDAAALPDHRVVLPIPGIMVVNSARSLKSFLVEMVDQNKNKQLEFRTPGWFQSKLELHIDGDYGTEPVKAFLGYYALHLR